MPEIQKDKIIKEYSEKQPIYKEFSNLAEGLLKVFLTSEGFKFQISNRVKEINRLAEKIDKKEKEGKKYEKLEDVEDLAGVRVVFYLESDRKRFVSLFFKHFNDCILSREEKYDPKGYFGLHIIFNLDKKRSELMEYKKYAGIKCEIQISTILFHAWSEVEHDIIYKPTGADIDTLKSLGLEDLKKNFEDIMAKHIKDATTQLDYINEKFNEIRDAGVVLASDFAKDFSEPITNDELDNKLEIIKKFCHKKPDEIMNIIKATLSKKPVKPSIIYRFDDKLIYGKTHKDIVLKCIELLSSPSIKYNKPDDFLDLISNLTLLKDKDIKNKALEAAKNFAEYNLDILRHPKIGYGVQNKAFNYVKSISKKDPVKYFDFIEIVLQEILNSSVSGRSTGLNDQSQITITMHFGAVGPTEFLRKLRKDAIDIIFKLYKTVKDENKKLRLVRILEEALRTPNNVAYGDDTKDMINNDAQYLIGTYRKMLFKNNKLIGNISIARDILRRIDLFYKTNERNTLEKNRLKEDILKDSFYSLFNLLIGDEVLFENQNNQERSELLSDKIKEINSSNAEKWDSRLNKIAKQFGLTEEWQFANFRNFLTKFAEQKPKIASAMLKGAIRRDKPLKIFTADILLGFRRKNMKIWNDFAGKIISSNDLNLLNSALMSLNIDDIKNKKAKDIVFISKIIKEKLSALRGDRLELNLKSILMSTLLSLYLKDAKKVENLVVYLIKNERDKRLLPIYIDHLTYPIYRNEVNLSNWKKDNLKLILDILVEVKGLNHSEQVLILGIAKKHFSEALNIFYRRIKEKTNRKESGAKGFLSDDRYDSIPYHINNELQEFIGKHKNFLKIADKWVNEMVPGTSLYNMELGEFFRNTNTLNDVLKQTIQKRGKDNLERALNLMWGIHSPDQDICLEIIKRTDDKKIWDHLGGILHNTGVVNDLAEAYDKKADSVENYKATGTAKEKKRINDFKIKVIGELRHLAELQRRDAEEELKIRRLEFGQ